MALLLFTGREETSARAGWVTRRSLSGLREVVASRQHAGVVVSLASTLITAGRGGGGDGEGGGTLVETYWLVILAVDAASLVHRDAWYDTAGRSAAVWLRVGLRVGACSELQATRFELNKPFFFFF